MEKKRKVDRFEEKKKEFEDILNNFTRGMEKIGASVFIAGAADIDSTAMAQFQRWITSKREDITFAAAKEIREAMEDRGMKRMLRSVKK